MLNEVTKTTNDPFFETIQNSITNFIDQFIANEVNDIEKKSISRQLWKTIGEFGLLGICAPVKFNGSNQSHRFQADIIEKLSYHSPALGLSYLAHSHLCMHPLIKYGTQLQQEKWLPKLVNGQYIGAICISEPQAGSDALAMTTSANLVGDKFILDGQKIWITNGPDADVAIVYAKTNPDAKHHGITAFIVDLNLPGVTRSKPIKKLGMRGSNTGALYFNQVKLSKSAVLGHIDAGLDILMQGLNIERVMLSAGPIGIQQACLDIVLRYISEREQFGRPLSSFQITQAKIADMYTRLESSKAFLNQAFNAYESNSLTNAQAASVYLHCSRAGVETSLEAVQILGGNGYTEEYTVEMLMRDAKLFDIGGGTNEIRQLIIAKSLIKDFQNKH